MSPNLQCKLNVTIYINHNIAPTPHQDNCWNKVRCIIENHSFALGDFFKLAFFCGFVFFCNGLFFSGVSVSIAHVFDLYCFPTNFFGDAFGAAPTLYGKKLTKLSDSALQGQLGEAKTFSDRLINMHAPLIKASRKKRKLMNKLWITKGLCLKRKLMNKFVFKPGMSNWRLFTLINLNKSRFRSQLTNAHFNSSL